MLLVVYFFLSSRTVAIAIAMIMAITPTTMYVIRSDVVAKFEGALVAVGAGVAVAAAAATTVANVCP